MSATGTQALAIHECRGSVAKICSGIKKRYPNNNDGGGGGGGYLSFCVNLFSLGGPVPCRMHVQINIQLALVLLTYTVGED
jgi:hypothetical protein